MQNRLDTQITRQEKALAELPGDFVFPLFNSRHAIESQRRSGYRNTAAAAREIVDNALEAGATKIHVVLDRAPGGKQVVNAIAFIDNGSGMLPQMARYALSWGGGTHFDDPDFIAKFGFGLPNASINQTRRVEVYTRTDATKPITMAWLDITDFDSHGMQSVPEPVQQDLPDFVKKYMARNKLPFEHGTVVVWVKPDRLTYKLAANLKEHLLDDFGVVYRNLLDGVELIVEGVTVEMIDPLFLNPKCRYYLPESEGGAIAMAERAIAVKYFVDPETGAHHLAKVNDPKELNDRNLLATGAIGWKVARFPIGFAVPKKKSEELNDAHRRFAVRHTRRGMSFVRAGREIETVDAFPRSSREEAKGLGHWPYMEAYAYHWAVEVTFGPQLDEVFGITNDKQRVRPIEDFWKVLAEEGVDAELRRENAWQAAQRERPKEKAERSNEPTPAETAATNADAIIGIVPRVPEIDKPRVQQAVQKVQEAIQKKVQAVGGQDKKAIEEAIEAHQEDAKRRPYVIDFFDGDERGAFFVPSWEVGNRIVVRINRNHAFYQTLYSDLLSMSGGRRAKEAVDVLLIALGRSELTVDDERTKQWYEEQRTSQWSRFLAVALKSLASEMPKPEQPTEAVA
jgi:histidine kinase/DNA gyrase B/HSP90-like ATPase